MARATTVPTISIRYRWRSTTSYQALLKQLDAQGHRRAVVVSSRGGGSATAAPTDSRPSIEWEKREEGETAFVPMKSAPYPHPSREKGYTYNKIIIPREPHYSDSTVGLFIPRVYRRTPKVNVLVYLHGWSTNLRKAISEFKLREQIVASGQNIILFFPQGPRDATDELFARSRTLFLHTETLKHGETVRWLERWLRRWKLD